MRTLKGYVKARPVAESETPTVKLVEVKGERLAEPDPPLTLAETVGMPDTEAETPMSPQGADTLYVWRIIGLNTGAT